MYFLVLFLLTMSPLARAEEPPTAPVDTLIPHDQDITSQRTSPEDRSSSTSSDRESNMNIHTLLNNLPSEPGPSLRNLAPPINTDSLTTLSPSRGGKKSPTNPNKSTVETRGGEPTGFKADKPSFSAFVKNRKNFLMSQIPMNKKNTALGVVGDGTIGMTGGDPKKTCFIVTRATDKVTEAIRQNIRNIGGTVELADNPQEVGQALLKCDARIGEDFPVSFCAHGREGYMVMGLWGLTRIDPPVAKMLAMATKKLKHKVLEARFVSCLVGGKIDEKVRLANNQVADAAPFHIMRQIAAAFDTYVLAFDKNLDVNSKSVSTKIEAHAIVVRLSPAGRDTRLPDPGTATHT